MKRGICLVLVLLVACLSLGGVAYAGDVKTAVALGGVSDSAMTRAAMESLQNQLNRNLPINGFVGVKVAFSVKTPGPAPTSISLAPMPDTLNTMASFNLNGFTNAFCYRHPVLVKPTPANASVVISTVTVELVSGTGKVSDYAVSDISGSAWFIFAKKAGKVKVTVTTDNNKTASKVITITDKLIPMKSLTLYTSETSNINYVPAASKTLYRRNDGTLSPFLLAVLSNPSSASYGGGTSESATVFSQGVAYTSSNDDIAAVDIGYGDALVYPKIPGAVVITGKAYDGGKAKATMKLTIKGEPVTSIQMSDIALQVGATQKVEPMVKPSYAWDQTLTWLSGNKKVATVDSNGYVTGVGAGTAKITCKNKASGKSASMNATVGYDKSETGVKYRFLGCSTRYSAQFNSMRCQFQACADSGYSESSYSYGEISKGSMLNSLSGFGVINDVHEQDVTTICFVCDANMSINQSERGAIYCGNEAITVNELQSALEKIPGTVILIMDCNLSGQYIAGKGTSSAATVVQENAFNKAWVDALSSSKASNFARKGLSGSTAKGKFKVLTSCGAMERQMYEVGDGTFTWFGYWLAMGLGMTPNLATGEPGSFASGNLRANTMNPSVPVVTLLEAYKYTKAQMAKEFTPFRRQNVMMWPANDQTAIINMVD